MQMVLSLLIACVFFASGYVYSSEPMLMAKLSLTKEKFVGGEPVEIKLTISNTGSKNARVYLNYPTFRAFDSGGISFNIVTAPAGVKQLLLDESERRVPVVEVVAGEEWSTAIYLQRFLANLSPGRYQISYTLETRFDTKMPDINSDVLSSKGEISFTVEPPRQQQLNEILNQYSSKLESPNFWERRAAIEALSLIEDPIVIPHLNSMLKLGLADDGLKALARFPKNEEAQSAVLNSLASKQASAVVQALKVLAGWGYEVNTNDLQSLLKRDNTQIKIAALRYVKTIGDKGYLEVIKPYLNDPNPDVSKAAQEAQSILQKP